MNRWYEQDTVPENEISVNSKTIVVPWWLSRLRSQHSHCSSSGHCFGAGLIPGPGTSTCCRHGQKKKKKVNIFCIHTLISSSPLRDLNFFSNHIFKNYVIFINKTICSFFSFSATLKTYGNSWARDRNRAASVTYASAVAMSDP